MVHLDCFGDIRYYGMWLILVLRRLSEVRYHNSLHQRLDLINPKQSQTFSDAVFTQGALQKIPFVAFHAHGSSVSLNSSSFQSLGTCATHSPV